MDQEDRIYASKMISKQHNHGNIIHINHGNGIQPNKNFKVFKKHRVNGHLLALLLSMISESASPIQKVIYDESEMNIIV